MESELDRDVALGTFLRHVDKLIERQVLRLWEFDRESEQRAELSRVPVGLEERYGAAGWDDRRYDPFGLTLTLGVAAPVKPEPAWEYTLDFERGRFEMFTLPGNDRATMDISRDHPEIALVVERIEPAGGRIRVVGRIVKA